MAMFGMKDDKKSLLIQEVYQRPVLWKVTDPRYTDVPSRWAAYAEIADALSDDEVKFSSEMIKLAWKNMMDYYNQIRRRNDRAAIAGLHPPSSKWQFFHMMHFTRQGKAPARRQYNWMEPSKDCGYYAPLSEDVIPAPIPIRPLTTSRMRQSRLRTK
ncbi:unnamed protein product [Toxocara canis]|uniref:MADF domain-containing protein n=1 Tax=Toxocara canis TaxID=6265 RepID=A0A183V2Q5_TOXCA|nr:unnamed protein product [Toxocara canis]